MTTYKRARAGRNGRTIAIGDIHGCSTALAALLAALDPQPDDMIVTLGDFVDRGPDSRGVIDQLIALEQACQLVALLGNHEQMLLGAQEGKSDREFWLKFGGQETLDSYWVPHGGAEIPASHLTFIRRCRRFLETETHIFAHANPAPNIPMEHQAENDLLWRPLDPDDAVGHYSGKTLIVGHTPQTDGRMLDLGFLKCLDTACHLSGWLTALDVHSGRIWQASQRSDRR
ncbi:MAG: metallophosphoesterase family protein [Pirellulaceae bacterium]